MIWESKFEQEYRNVRIISSYILTWFREKMSLENLEILWTPSYVIVMNMLRIPESQIDHRTTRREQQPNKEYSVFIYLQYARRTWCSVLKTESADLPFVRALVRRVRWLKEKGNLLVQLNQLWPRANPSLLLGGGITLTEVVGLRVAYGVYREERRLWGGEPDRRVEWGRGGGGSTVAVRGGEAQGRRGAAAVPLLPLPFSASQFRLLAVVSPWRVYSGTRSSPEVRTRANIVPPHLQFQLKLIKSQHLQLK